MYLRIKLVDQDSDWDLSTIRGTVRIDNQLVDLDGSASEISLLNTIPTTASARSTTINSVDSDLDGRSVNVGLESGDYIRFQIPFSGVNEKANITITFYHQTDDSIVYYSNSFELYDYDLGNNPNVSISDNPPFIIFISEDPRNVDIDLVRSNFIAYRKPFTSEVFFYDATNSDGIREYFGIDNLGNETQIGNSKNGIVCFKGNLAIKQLITLNRYEIVSDNCGGITQILLPGFPIIDESTQVYNGTSVFSSILSYDRNIIRNLLLREYQWIPDSELYTSCFNQNKECIVLENQVFAGLLLESSDIPILRDEDVLKHPYDQLTIDYQVININGEVEFNKNVILPISYLFTFSLNDITRIDFIPKSIGDYVVHAKYSLIENDQTIIECEASKKIISQHWFKRTQLECNLNRLDNLSFDQITIKIYKLNNNKEFELDQSTSEITIDALEYFDLVFNSDGIYQLEVIRNDVSLFQIVNNYCGLQKCLEKVTVDFLCGQYEKCSNENLYYLFGLLTTSYTHFLLLNNEYNFNYIYESLRPSKLEELFQIQETLNKALEYCTLCGLDVTTMYVKESNCNCNQ